MLIGSHKMMRVQPIILQEATLVMKTNLQSGIKKPHREVLLILRLHRSMATICSPLSRLPMILTVHGLW